MNSPSGVKLLFSKRVKLCASSVSYIKLDALLFQNNFKCTHDDERVHKCRNWGGGPWPPQFWASCIC